MFLLVAVLAASVAAAAAVSWPWVLPCKAAGVEGWARHLAPLVPGCRCSFHQTRTHQGSCHPCQQSCGIMGSVRLFVWLVGFLTSSSTTSTRLYRGRAPKTERLTILRAAPHETELGDHNFCLSRSYYTDIDPASR